MVVYKIVFFKGLNEVLYYFTAVYFIHSLRHMGDWMIFPVSRFKNVTRFLLLFDTDRERAIGKVIIKTKSENVPGWTRTLSQGLSLKFMLYPVSHQGSTAPVERVFINV